MECVKYYAHNNITESIPSRLHVFLKESKYWILRNIFQLNIKNKSYN